MTDARELSVDHPGNPCPGEPCPKCKAKIIWHCSECKVQITACVCSLKAALVSEIGEEGLAELEEESRKDRLRQEGIWTPDSTERD